MGLKENILSADLNGAFRIPDDDGDDPVGEKVPQTTQEQVAQNTALLHGHMESSAFFQGRIQSAWESVSKQLADLTTSLTRFIERYETEREVRDERFSNLKSRFENGINERVERLEGLVKELYDGCGDWFVSRREHEATEKRLLSRLDSMEEGQRSIEGIMKWGIGIIVTTVVTFGAAYLGGIV